MKLTERFLKFFTSAVFVFIFIGAVLTIVGQSNFILSILDVTDKSKYYSFWLLISSSLRSIGAAFVGSGVFTAIIKSSEYLSIFTKVMEDIIWSKKFIEKRADKKEIWKTVSSLLYEEKFPSISDDLLNLITGNYFPINDEYYFENYEILLNIVSANEFFWHQSETVSMTIKAVNKTKKITYNMGNYIDLPSENIEDKTAISVDEIIINGAIHTNEIPASFVKGNQLCLEYDLILSENDEYHLKIKRDKVVCKRTNPDKRMFASGIVKDLRVTVITDTSINISLIGMGTINDFVEGDNQLHNGTKVLTWNYKGIMLPSQGFMLLLK